MCRSGRTRQGVSRPRWAATGSNYLFRTPYAVDSSTHVLDSSTHVATANTDLLDSSTYPRDASIYALDRSNDDRPSDSHMMTVTTRFCSRVTPRTPGRAARPPAPPSAARPR